MYLLFDIGGTHSRFATSSDGKSFSDVRVFDTPRKYKDGVALIKAVADELSNKQNYNAVIGGVAASFDKEGEKLAGGGPQISDWLQKPLKKDVEKALGVKAHLRNDAMMGALAQSHFGPAQGKKVSAYVTVSTGVGGARVVDGKIDENTFGFEPGWQIIDAANQLCNGWSKRGYLIDYIGGIGIERNKNARTEDIHDENFWRSRAEFLAYGLHNIAVVWSPEIISIGGGVAQRIPFDEVERYYYQSIIDVFPSEHPMIVQAQYGDEMGLWGALGYIKMYKV